MEIPRKLKLNRYSLRYTNLEVEWTISCFPLQDLLENQDIRPAPKNIYTSN